MENYLKTQIKPWSSFRAGLPTSETVSYIALGRIFSLSRENCNRRRLKIWVHCAHTVINNFSVSFHFCYKRISPIGKWAFFIYFDILICISATFATLIIILALDDLRQNYGSPRISIKSKFHLREKLTSRYNVCRGLANSSKLESTIIRSFFNLTCPGIRRSRSGSWKMQLLTSHDGVRVV